MSRRSSRLMSGGYYNSDDESDSSSVTNISYREVPVKVFKKKGTRSSGSRTPKRTNSNGSSVSAESPEVADIIVTPVSGQADPTMRTVPFTKATPRPALTHSSSRGQTPTPSAPPADTNLHFRLNTKLLCQSSVDSSGYSSSEGTNNKPKPIVGTPSRPNSGAPSLGYRRRATAAFDRLVGLSLTCMSLVAVAVKSKWTRVAALANDPSVRKLLRKVGIFCVLLIVVVLCLWFLLPLFFSSISQMSLTRTTSQSRLPSPPVAPAVPAPPAARPEILRSQVVDPVVVSNAVDDKMQQVLEKLQMKQAQLLLQMKQQLDVDIQIMKAKLDAASASEHLRLEKEIAQLGRQLNQYQTASRATADSLVVQIQNLEAQNSKVAAPRHRRRLAVTVFVSVVAGLVCRAAAASS